VELVEYIGDYKLITCDVSGKKIKALCSISTSYEKNQQVWISADPNNIHVFDKETEIALQNGSTE
jgi:ABC-type sugar transport system ATPase subunit